MSTVSLQMIVKDEYQNVLFLLTQAAPYFDEINLTVSDRLTADQLKKAAPKTVNVQYRKWTGRFDEARNANLEMCTTDLFFWLDADDEFDFAAVPQLVEIADQNNIDSIFLPYNYAQDDQGNCITRHWRERLIRTGKGYESRGWVHETFITDEPVVSHKVNFEVIHHSDGEHVQESIQRNHSILEKAFEETNDPRYLHYLGMSYFSHGEYEKSATYLSDYLEVGGSIEDTYRALSVISECAYHLGKEDMALEYASKTIVLKPEYPMGYWLMAQYEADQGNWKEALEWVNTSMTKPDPDTLSVYDPSARERAILIAAQAEFMLANYNQALAWLRKIPKNTTALTLFEDFHKEADAETFVNLLPKIRKFFNNDRQLFAALCHDIKYDTRIKQLRNIATAPATWGDKDVTIFCGQGYEEWSPATMDKGMGGSEEAIVYLSRELSKLGYSVTVYGEVTEPLLDTTVEPKEYAVQYLPWKEIDTRDNFNIFISWRAPQYLERIKAKVKLCDVHDVLPVDLIKPSADVKYLVKSQYHRNLYPDVPDDKFVIIGNGISKEQFSDLS